MSQRILTKRLVDRDPTLDCIDFCHGNTDVSLWTRFRFKNGGMTAQQAKEQIVLVRNALASNPVVHTLRIRASFLTHLDFQTPSAFVDSLHAPGLRELMIEGDKRTLSFNTFALARIVARHSTTLERLSLRDFAVVPQDDSRPVATEWKGALLQAVNLKHLEIKGVLSTS